MTKKHINFFVKVLSFLMVGGREDGGRGKGEGGIVVVHVYLEDDIFGIKSVLVGISLQNGVDDFSLQQTKN